jgi:hypothetical protein
MRPALCCAVVAMFAVGCSSGRPSSKIQASAFGDAQLARDRRVEVLIRTAN